MSVVSSAAVVASSPTVKNVPMQGATADEGRMTAADLAAKKMLLPFIKDLSFIEIALEEVRKKLPVVRFVFLFLAQLLVGEGALGLTLQAGGLLKCSA